MRSLRTLCNCVLTGLLLRGELAGLLLSWTGLHGLALGQDGQQELIVEVNWLGKIYHFIYCGNFKEKEHIKINTSVNIQWEISVLNCSYPLYFLLTKT